MKKSRRDLEESTRLLEKQPLQSSDEGLHPHLGAQITELAVTAGQPPDSDSWRRFVASVDRSYREMEGMSRDPIENMRGWASFENLFRMSPIPLMEQDYTKLEEWMGDLRQQGVTDLWDYLGDDIDTIRAIVPMIKMVAANPAALHAVGLTPDEFIGPIDPKIVNEGAEPGWIAQLDAVWHRHPVAHASFKAATADGRTYDAESVLSAPVVDGEPDFSRAVFTLMDVTGHRNEERRMSELVQSKDAFLASVSHEIRTPLTAIMGFAQILDDKEESPDDNDRDLMVSLIVQQAREVASLVEDLLVVARTEMGRIDIIETTVDVVHELQQTLEAGGSFTTGVVVDCQTERPLALGDPVRIRQILRNLLTNAERYGGPNVRVTVTAQNGRLLVEVADDGPGLQTGQWERIFEPYHRAHELLEQPGSVGIGLTISRQLTELMSGTLDYRYEAGYSIFSLGLRAAVT